MSRQGALMDRELEQLARGQISFDVFERKTRTHWRRLARGMYSSWCKDLPPSVTAEDVRQEMLLNLWRNLAGFDPSRNRTLRDYAVFQAWSGGYRFIQVERGSPRRDGRRRGPKIMYECERHMFTKVDDASLASKEKYTLDDVCEVLDAKRAFDRALKAARGPRAYALVALYATGGRMHEAAVRLYEEKELRIKKRWGSTGDAAKFLRRTVRESVAA